MTSPSGAVRLSVCLFVSLGPAIGAADYSCSNCVEQVSAGGEHTCGLRDDATLTCWGSDSSGQSTPPDPSPSHYDFLQVSAGESHTCAIVDCIPAFGFFCPFGNARCWGENAAGQASPDLNFRFSQVSAGFEHSCGVRTDGTVDCWGRNDEGQATPPDLPSNNDFIQVSAGEFHTCSVVQCRPGGGIFCPIGNALCWGLDTSNQASPPINIAFRQISAGDTHSCGVRTSGSIVCWGDNTSDKATPPAGSFLQVSAGESHTCGVKTDGSVACWGDNSKGQSAPPTGTFEQVSAGRDHTCGLRSNGSVACWGDDLSGQSLPTAGLCGFFRDDFEAGGICRWANSATPFWTADCDGDGLAAANSPSFCVSVPIGVPAECPGGSWVDQQPACGAYDCLDLNADVYAGQTSFFDNGYDGTGGSGDRFDYNCDGAEETQFDNMNTDALCCAYSSALRRCVASANPGCGSAGWDSATVFEIPACGETADFVTCSGNLLGCSQTTVQRIQACR